MQDLLESQYRKINDCILRGGSLRELVSELMYASYLTETEDLVATRLGVGITELNSIVQELHGVSNSLEIIRQRLQSAANTRSQAV